MEFTNKYYDAIVIGSGPNGLSCAIALAQKGLSVAVVEKFATVGGGTRTQELTLPGFLHDVCSAVHPLAVASPFFKSLPLHEYGLKWLYPQAEVAHPRDDGGVTLLKRSIVDTAKSFGRDQSSYKSFFEPLVAQFDDLMTEILAPPLHAPKHLSLLAKFGLNALLSANSFARLHFREENTRALFMGIAAHSAAPLTHFASSAAGLALHIAGHGSGWPIPEGGAKNISLALASYFKSLGGELVINREIQSLVELPKSHGIFFDLTPRQILKIAGASLPKHIAQSLQKFQYGPGVFKMDWALNSPIPWKNPDCALAGTVHLGGSSQEIIHSENAVNAGILNARPFVILSQPTLFDPTRAPSDLHIAWAYCHVPHGSNHDMRDTIENQIERFAPGFKKTILKSSCLFPKDLESRNPNLIGGDISGGLVNARQIFFRPRLSLNPYRLTGPDDLSEDDRRQLWICSSSTPPGPGVHGMCGYHAAQRALSQKMADIR